MAAHFGLPSSVGVCLFDLDGVLTDTATVHAAAWKQMFDAFLATWAEGHHQPFVPFDPASDYQDYVDGKPRPDGVRSFLASRGIELPEGAHDAAPDEESVHGLGNRKNVQLLKLIDEDGVVVYEGSRRYVEAVRRGGLRTAVVSSSANTTAVLRSAGLDHLFDLQVDGLTIEREHLLGKPAPDTFLVAASRLGVAPAEASVFEDALAGVAAGRAGHFGFVVGVDRVGRAADLRASGADVVVSDLAELLEDA